MERFSCAYMAFPQLHFIMSPYEFTACCTVKAATKADVVRLTKQEEEDVNAQARTPGRRANAQFLSTDKKLVATIRSRFVVPAPSRKLLRHPRRPPPGASDAAEELYLNKRNEWARFVIAFFWPWERVKVDVDGREIICAQPM